MLAATSTRALQFSVRRQLTSNATGGFRRTCWRNRGPQHFNENPLFKKFISPLYYADKHVPVSIRMMVLGSTIPVNFIMWRILMEEDAINSFLGDWAQALNLTTGCVSLPISIVYTTLAVNVFCWTM